MSYITLAPLAGTPDPELAPMPCEYPSCPKALPMRDCHSFILVIQHVSTAKKGHASVQCDREQHWACCHAHAVAVAHLCLDEHHEEVTRQSYTPHRNSARLLAGRLCAHPACGQELTTDGFHVAVTYAMCGSPLETLPDGTVRHRGYRGTHYKDVAGGEYWGCSLAHATDIGHAILEHVTHTIPHYEEGEPHAPPTL